MIINILHVDIKKSHVNIIKFHVDILHVRDKLSMPSYDSGIVKAIENVQWDSPYALKGLESSVKKKII